MWLGRIHRRLAKHHRFPLAVVEGAGHPFHLTDGRFRFRKVEGLRGPPRRRTAFWWGVGAATVGKWRRAVGAASNNERTTKLRQLYAREDWFKQAQRKAWSKARDPERRAKIAAAKRGVPRSKATIAKMRKANLGKWASATTRTKMSIAAWRRGARPPAAGVPWTVEEDYLCRTLPPAEVVSSAPLGRSFLTASVFSTRFSPPPPLKS